MTLPNILEVDGLVYEIKSEPPTKQEPINEDLEMLARIRLSTSPMLQYLKSNVKSEE